MKCNFFSFWKRKKTLLQWLKFGCCTYVCDCHDKTNWRTAIAWLHNPSRIQSGNNNTAFQFFSFPLANIILGESEVVDSEISQGIIIVGKAFCFGNSFLPCGCCSLGPINNDWKEILMGNRTPFTCPLDRLPRDHLPLALDRLLFDLLPPAGGGLPPAGDSSSAIESSSIAGSSSSSIGASSSRGGVVTNIIIMVISSVTCCRIITTTTTDTKTTLHPT
mmetsp:Transcript_19549/g.42172  ORF Transcript_19549/g.42172 Transcript_19549/m.42172 type:complete len:219 (-) Transcript_19549:446-1102(-)